MVIDVFNQSPLQCELRNGIDVVAQCGSKQSEAYIMICHHYAFHRVYMLNIFSKVSSISLM